MLYHLHGFIHGFLSSRPTRGQCTQAGNGSPKQSWMFWMWHITDFHLASVRSASPSELVTLQYRWLTILETQGFIGSHPLILPSDWSFFFNPTETNSLQFNKLYTHTKIRSKVFLKTKILTDTQQIIHFKAFFTSLLPSARCQTNGWFLGGPLSSFCWCRSVGPL